MPNWNYRGGTASRRTPWDPGDPDGAGTLWLKDSARRSRTVDMALGILDELGILHGTDKGSLGHGYLGHYERILGPLRDEPITILEIGVSDGASLRMWADYFTRATIVGVDINEVLSPARRGSPRCRDRFTGR